MPDAAPNLSAPMPCRRAGLMTAAAGELNKPDPAGTRGAP